MLYNISKFKRRYCSDVIDIIDFKSYHSEDNSEFLIVGISIFAKKFLVYYIMDHTEMYKLMIVSKLKENYDLSKIFLNEQFAFDFDNSDQIVNLNLIDKIDLHIFLGLDYFKIRKNLILWRKNDQNDN